MSYRNATYLVLALLALLGGAYLWTALQLHDPSARGAIGPGYFPVILAVLLIALCVIAFIQTLRRREDRVLAFPNTGLIALTLVATGLFLVAWRYLDWFYALVFILAAVLVTSFGKRRDLRQNAVNMGVAGVLTLAIWGLFGHLMQVRF